MKKKILNMILIAVLLIGTMFALTGCGNNQQGEHPNESEENQNIKGKQNVFESIKLIETTNTVEEINGIMGFEGECTDEENKVYKWEVTDDTSVRVQYSKYSTDTGATIEINFPGKAIADDKIDFTKVNEIKSAMNTKDSITYDEAVEKLGGVQGTLKYKASGTLRYEWDKTDGEYLTLTFDVKSMKCTFLSGMVK